MYMRTDRNINPSLLAYYYQCCNYLRKTRVYDLYTSAVLDFIFIHVARLA